MTSVAWIFISQIKGRLKIGFQTTFMLTNNEVAKEQIFQTTLNVNYSGLNLNQYGVASTCRTICTVCGFIALS